MKTETPEKTGAAQESALSLPALDYHPLTRVLFGARISLAIGLVSAAVSAAIGVAIGATAGYTNGWIGYLPTADAFAEGGYEPSTSVFTGAAEQHVRDAVVTHLQSLRH